MLPIDAKARTQCVRPYVEDVKNCVVLKPDASLNLALDEIASLQAALQRAIERVFSIEDSELAVFPLPNDAKRSELLFYEAAEGGAGVLRKLLDPIKFQEVVREAIDVCHFNPETDVDLRHGPNARENCDAACYDCLLSYGNQRDHALLDRKKAHEILRQLRDATLKVSSTSNTRAEQLRALANQPHYMLCDEATSALDSRTTLQVLDLLARINADLGVTMVVITHSLDVARRICNRIAVIENGHIVEEGPTADVFAHPQSEVTRELLDWGFVGADEPDSPQAAEDEKEAARD